MMRRQITACAALLGIAGALGCSSSSTPPRPLPTLLVTNPSCSAGQCQTLEIRAFVLKFTVPQPSWGSRVVGEIHGPTTCLTFPSSWTLTTKGPRDSTATT